MHIILATVGTRGDVQPMIALAQALHKRGHTASVACPESFAVLVRAHGVEHRALGEDLQALMVSGGESVERSILGMKRYFTEQMRLQAPRLMEIAQGANVIVGTAMAWTAASVAEKLGIRALVLLPTSCVRSRLHPPPLFPLYGLPRPLNALLWSLNNGVQDRLMGEPLNVARAGLELPPVASFTEHLFIDTPCVIAADDTFLPPDPAWNGRYPYVGYLFAEDTSPLDPTLHAWLAKGEPPVCVGFGSMAGGKLERVCDVVRAAIGGTGSRCLVLGGSAELFAKGGVPDNFFVVRDAPHHALFPRVELVVHHGGAGTTAAALRAGVPQVVLPMMLDQYHHAHHAVRAGVGASAASMARVTASRLAQALSSARALTPEPRRILAQRIARSDAGRVLAERIEGMVSVSARSARFDVRKSQDAD